MAGIGSRLSLLVVSACLAGSTGCTDDPPPVWVPPSPPVQPIEIQPLRVDVPAWKASPLAYYHVWGPEDPHREGTPLTYDMPWGHSLSIFRSSGGFLPLPIQEIVVLRTRIAVDFDRVEMLAFAIDDWNVTLDSGQLAGQSSLQFRQGAYAIELERIGSRSGRSFGIDLRIWIVTSQVPMRPHRLDIQWSLVEGGSGVRWLYFSPVLDATAVQWESESVLWVGTLSQGILRLDLGQDLKSSADDRISRVLVRHRIREFQPKPEFDGVRYIVGSVSSLLRTTDGYLWVGHGGAARGISVIGPKGQLITTSPGEAADDLGQETVVDFMEVGPGLVGSVGLEWGLGIFDAHLNLVAWKFEREDGLMDKDVSGVALDRNGNLWLSTFDITEDRDVGVDGMAVFDGRALPQVGGRVATFEWGDGFEDDLFYDVEVDSRNRIWLPSSKGLYVLDYGKDVADKSDDRLVLDSRYGGVTKLGFVSDSSLLLADGSLTYLDHKGTLDKFDDDVMLQYELPASDFALNPRNGIVATSPCSGKSLFCALLRGEFVTLLPEGGSAPSSKIVEFETEKGEQTKYREYEAPCWGVSFVQFGAAEDRTDDDEVWTLYPSEGVFCPYRSESMDESGKPLERLPNSQ